jgi:general secretion pathway protein E
MAEYGLATLEELPTPETTLLQQVSYSYAKQHLLLPLSENEKVRVAIADPLAVEALDELTFRFGKEIEALLCPEELLVAAIDAAYHAAPEPEQEKLEEYDLLDPRHRSPVVRLINLVLAEAIKRGASDVHFEPRESDLRIRYRIDGVLQERNLPTREHRNELITRLKVMARLDIAEHRLPQDGRIKLRMGEREIDFRVSTLPTGQGERVVLRILDKGNILLGLDHLGMPPPLLEQLRELISLPEGILLVTGPTGSGKTTTLYSALTEVASSDINVMTTEDPVEYKLPGIAQIGVHPKIGLTFATSLRHILRQDPDVIMVGEIRDTETAEIAIQASLTGHLVLSTLHTNDAPSALTRLVDMGVEPYLLSSSVVGVLAQRLVRTICTSCHGSGCSDCFETGYRGRCGLYELMPMSDALRHRVVQSPDAGALRNLAADEGMEMLATYGERLVEAGITSREEVLRVTRGI